MNTRDKILDAPTILVIGTFAPLLAVHAARLADLKHPDAKLVVAVSDTSDCLLERRSRMELVAALRMVDFVLPYATGLETALPWTAVHDDTALHATWLADFKEHVRWRSQSS